MRKFGREFRRWISVTAAVGLSAFLWTAGCGSGGGGKSLFGGGGNGNPFVGGGVNPSSGGGFGTSSGSSGGIGSSSGSTSVCAGGMGGNL
jgi:hypothetical protein